DMSGAIQHGLAERAVRGVLYPVQRSEPVANEPHVLRDNDRLAMTPRRGYRQGAARIETLQDVERVRPTGEAIDLAGSLEPPDRYRHAEHPFYDVETRDADPRALVRRKCRWDATRNPSDVQTAGDVSGKKIFGNPLDTSEMRVHVARDQSEPNWRHGLDG